jgi:TonB family protein
MEKPKPKPSAGTPSDDAFVSTDAQNAGAGVPMGTSGAKVGLDGRPIGSTIYIGQTQSYSGSTLGQPTIITKQTQYTSTSAMETFANLSNQDKAILLARLAQIPGIYKAGQAPTPERIISMGNAIVPRKEDVDALTKVMTYSDKVGEDYSTSVAKFFFDKNLAMQYFGTGGVKSAPSVTPSDALVAELNSNFLDIFNAAPDKKTAAAYAKEVQQLEIKQKGAISAQQREDIRLKYIQRTAATRYKTVTGTADTADDAMLQEGALGATVRTLRQAYSNNGVPINESEIYKKAIQATRSPQALENILNITKQQATALFPAFKDLIAQGADVAELVSPYDAPVVPTEEPIKEEPMTRVEQMPVYSDGDVTTAIARLVTYPDIEKENSIQGTVYVQFVVNKEGKVEDVKVIRGVKEGAGLEREAIRAVRSLKPFSPGYQNGKAVSVKMTVPIKFSLK